MLSYRLGTVNDFYCHFISCQTNKELLIRSKLNCTKYNLHVFKGKMFYILARKAIGISETYGVPRKLP